MVNIVLQSVKKYEVSDRDMGFVEEFGVESAFKHVRDIVVEQSMLMVRMLGLCQEQDRLEVFRIFERAFEFSRLMWAVVESKAVTLDLITLLRHNRTKDWPICICYQSAGIARFLGSRFAGKIKYVKVHNFNDSKAIDEFNSGEAQIVVCHYKMLDAIDRSRVKMLYFIEMPWKVRDVMGYASGFGSDCTLRLLKPSGHESQMSCLERAIYVLKRSFHTHLKKVFN